MRRKKRKRWDSWRKSGFAKKIRGFIARNRQIIRAYLIFFAAILSFATFLFFMSLNDLFIPSLRRVYAVVTGFILGLLGNPVRVSGTLITSPSYSMEVVTACTGLFVTTIFLSAVIAYPCRLRTKLIGVAIGIPGIFLLNVVRLVTLFYVGIYLPRFADRVHLLVWQSLIILLVLVLWLFWVGRFAHASAPQRQKQG